MNDMGETKHTPGPWKREGSQIVEAARDHMRICFLPSDWKEYSNAVADAHLIVAAPDMLNVLHWIRANYASGPTKEINSRIDAAIAKAEGRS